MKSLKNRFLNYGAAALAAAMMLELASFASVAVNAPHPNGTCPGIACRNASICYNYAGPGCGNCTALNGGGVGTCGE